MKKEVVGLHQSIWDLAAMHYGAPEGVGLLIQDNPGVFDLENTPVPGTAFLVRDDAIDKKNVEYFKYKGIKPASAVEQVFQPSNWILANKKWNTSGRWFTNVKWSI